MKSCKTSESGGRESEKMRQRGGGDEDRQMDRYMEGITKMSQNSACRLDLQREKLL